MPRLLELRKCCKSWSLGERSFTCLEGVDLEVEAGTSLAIVGPSGCGKSTLLHVIALLTSLDSGAILLNGREVSASRDGTDHQVRGAFGLIFQDGKLIPSLTVMENVCLPLMHQGVWPHAQKAMASEILKRVGLSERASHRPGYLSGGEMMRAAIARALVHRPSIVLADEPTGNLDSETGAEIADLLFSVADDHRALVMVTHNETLAARADRVIRMADGRVEISKGGMLRDHE